MASLRNLPELKKNVCATFLFSWFMVNVCDFLQSFCIFFFFLSRPFSHLSLNYLQSSQREMVLAKSSQRAVWLSWGRCLLAPIAPMQNPGSCSNTWVYLYMNSYVYLEIGVFRLCSTSPSLYLCILSIVHTADLSVHMRSTSTRFPFARFRLAKKLLPIALSLSLSPMDLTDSERADPNQRFPIFMTSDVLFITVFFNTQHLGAWCASVPGPSSGSTQYWPSWCCRALLSYYDGSRTHTLKVCGVWMFMTGQRKHLLAMCVGESPTKIYFKDIYRSSLPHSSFPSFNLQFRLWFLSTYVFSGSFVGHLWRFHHGCCLGSQIHSKIGVGRSNWHSELMLLYLLPWAKAVATAFGWYAYKDLHAWQVFASVLLQSCFEVWLVETITEWLDEIHLLDHLRV